MKKLFPAAICAAMIGWSGVAGAITIENGTFDGGNTTGWIIAIPNDSPGSVSVVPSTTASDGTEYNALVNAPFAEITATASIRQSGLNWNAEEQLTFNWAFLGFDLDQQGQFNDFAFFRITDQDGGELFYDVFADIDRFGEFGDSGWRSYSYSFANSGSGSIEFGVVNVGDEGNEELEFSSKLLVDDVGFDPDKPGPQPAPIPEPGTILLFGTGLVGLAGFARRRRTSKTC